MFEYVLSRFKDRQEWRARLFVPYSRCTYVFFILIFYSLKVTFCHETFLTFFLIKLRRLV